MEYPIAKIGVMELPDEGSWIAAQTMIQSFDPQTMSLKDLGVFIIENELIVDDYPDVVPSLIVVAGQYSLASLVLWLGVDFTADVEVDYIDDDKLIEEILDKAKNCAEIWDLPDVQALAAQCLAGNFRTHTKWRHLSDSQVFDYNRLRLGQDSAPLIYRDSFHPNSDS